MPLCPECQTPYEDGQHFCKQCGHELSTGLPSALQCPRCGTSVSPEQNFCHQCDASLKPELTRPVQEGPRKWLLGAAVAAAAVLLLVVVLQLTRSSSPPPSPPAPAPAVTPAVPPAAKEAAKPAEAEPAKPAPAADALRRELEKVLNNVKEANLQKDIVLYMSCLSYVYPQLDKKRQEVLKTWEKFDFKKMAFNMSKVQDLGSDDALAVVSWSTLTQNLTTKDMQPNDFQYQVWFAKELGQWKIKKIEDLEP